MRHKLITLAIVFGLLIPSAIVLGQESTLNQGRIDDTDPYKRYPVTVKNDGTTIIADIRPTVEGEDLDTVLYLLDSTGAIVAENDDRDVPRFNKDTSSRLEFPRAPVGDYTIIATRYKVDEGKSSGDYEIEISLQESIEETPLIVTDDDLIATGFPPLDPRPEAEWTILVYYGGDNNLEPGILNDLDEFEVGGGSTDDVRVIAMIDRSPDFTDSNGNWDTVRLFEMRDDVSGDRPHIFPTSDVATIDTPDITDLNELDTAERHSLAEFLIWGMRQYPARHYVVAFGSHGAAWKGLIQDDTSDHDLLSVPELQEAFKVALANSPADSFDLLVNDACLMSSVEYFAGVAPYFDYALASAEVVVDPALDMTFLVEVLRAGSENLPDIGTQLVNFYIERDVLRQDAADAGYLTFAMTDLNQFDPVVQAVEAFAAVVNENPSIYTTLLGDARKNTYNYTNFLGESKQIDLGDFMRQIIALSTDGAIIEAAENVINALDDARIYGNAGEIVGEYTSFYNIFFPDNSKYFTVDYLEQTPLDQWSQMLRNYFNNVTPQAWSVGGEGYHLPVAPKVTITSVYPSGPISMLSQVEMNLEIIGRRISYGEFTIDQPQDDGSARRLYQQRLIDTSGLELPNPIQPGVDNVVFNWDATLPIISDGTHRNNELLVLTEKVGFLDGRYRATSDDPWLDVGVVFSINDNYTGGTVQRVVNRAPDSDALAVINIPTGAEFQAYSSIVTADGRVVAEANEALTYIWPDGGLTWEAKPAPSGTFELGLLITAFGGTTGFASQSITVDNDAVNQDLIGALWSDLNFKLVHPVAWSRLALPREGDLVLTSQNAAGTERIIVTIILDDDNNLDQIADTYENEYKVALENRTETRVNNLRALDVTYNRSTEAGTMQGHGFVVFNPWLGSGLGMLVSAEVLTAQEGDLDALYNLLVEYFEAIDGVLLSERDTRQWKSSVNPIDNLRYPVRLDWLPSLADGEWTKYAPRARENSPTFAAMRHVENADSLTFLFKDLQDEINAGLNRLLVGDELFYYGQNHSWLFRDGLLVGGGHKWKLVQYTGERDGLPIMGRLYVTLYEGDGYAMWFETVNDDTAPALFTDIFEPMLDGFLIGTLQEIE